MLLPGVLAIRQALEGESANLRVSQQAVDAATVA